MFQQPKKTSNVMKLYMRLIYELKGNHVRPHERIRTCLGTTHEEKDGTTQTLFIRNQGLPEY